MSIMEINEFAKRNDLAKKFEKAIETISVGNGWAVFAGLERGETLVKVVYDGQIRFEAVRKPEVKPTPKKKPTAAKITLPILEDEEYINLKPIEGRGSNADDKTKTLVIELNPKSEKDDIEE